MQNFKKRRDWGENFSRYESRLNLTFLLRGLLSLKNALEFVYKVLMPSFVIPRQKSSLSYQNYKILCIEPRFLIVDSEPNQKKKKNVNEQKSR